jgi:high affinity Mn2+ porin
VVTIGKFSVVDVFDSNQYAHDPRNDFLNWSIIELGTFDYAADAWGYTYGAAAEWYQDWWTVRMGLVRRLAYTEQCEVGPGFHQSVPVCR